MVEKQNVLIVIEKRQYDWLKSNCLNISAFVRQCIDEKISKGVMYESKINI